MSIFTMCYFSSLHTSCANTSLFSHEAPLFSLSPLLSLLSPPSPPLAVGNKGLRISLEFRVATSHESTNKHTRLHARPRERESKSRARERERVALSVPHARALSLSFSLSLSRRECVRESERERERALCTTLQLSPTCACVCACVCVCMCVYMSIIIAESTSETRFRV